MIERHLDSTSYYYACSAVLRFKDFTSICENSFPSENLKIRPEYENWLNDQSPYVKELEQVCKSDSANYKKMKDLFAKDDAQIKVLLLKNSGEFLEGCKSFKKGLKTYPKDDSKKMLWELVH
ncbi:hypothetical protein [Leptospira neocaledonica]|nr:hypothetical protein [Leptospira neocaledonica]